jgi:hypothetical protein
MKHVDDKNIFFHFHLWFWQGFNGFNGFNVTSDSGGQTHGGLAIVNFLDEKSCGQCLQKLLAMSDGSLSGIKSIGQSYIQGFAERLNSILEFR